MATTTTTSDKTLTKVPDRETILTADTDQAYELMQTPKDGLSKEEAESRLEKFGPNEIVGTRAYPLWKLALDQLRSPLIYVLIVAGTITLVLALKAEPGSEDRQHHLTDTFVIFAVVFINGLIGFVQEWRANRAIEALQQLTEPQAHVRRDGRVVTVDRAEIVPGDILVLESGTRLAADVRLVRTVELRNDESLLTGESMAVEKTAKPLEESTTLAADMRNMSFAGSLVAEGRGLGIVVHTGSATELGKISEAMAKAEKAETPLQTRMHRFANQIAIAIVGLAALVFGVGMAQGMEPLAIFLVVVAMAVGAIPEGLPIAVTVVLSLGIHRMAARRALVRRLPAAETMGSTEIICSDKTGTITENRMTVRYLAWGPWVVVTDEDADISCPEEQIGPSMQSPDDIEPALHELAHLLEIGVYCNNADYDPEAEKGDHFRGSPTEVALLEAGALLAPHVLREREQNAPTAEVPFSSTRKFMATVHQVNGDYELFAKGSPEAILQRCTCQWTPDGEEPLNAGHWNEVAAALAARGQRVIGLGRRTWSSDAISEKQVAELTFVGLVGILDPPRREAVEAVKGCKKSGVKVVMITGDHAATARAISRDVGILGGDAGPEQAEDDPRVMTGAQLDEMSDEQLGERVEDVVCYARVTPHHKLRIVELLQERGRTVAVTGDGVNDAPALRKAHIGIAMGKGGTDAAREASDVVLTDDSFATIYHAIVEGRYIFENIRKVTLFLLSTGVSEVLAILVCLIAGLGLPMTAAQILWINLVTNGLQDKALAFERGESFVLRRRPRGARMPIIDRLMLQHMLVIMFFFGLSTVGAFWYALENPPPGFSAEEQMRYARTMAVTTVVMLQMLNVFVCRSLVYPFWTLPVRNNPILFVCVVLAMAAQLSLLYTTPMQTLFGTVPLTFDKWLIILPIAVCGMFAVELSKWHVRRSGIYLED